MSCTDQRCLVSAARPVRVCMAAMWHAYTHCCFHAMLLAMLLEVMPPHLTSSNAGHSLQAWITYTVQMVSSRRLSNMLAPSSLPPRRCSWSTAPPAGSSRRCAPPAAQVVPCWCPVPAIPLSSMQLRWPVRHTSLNTTTRVPTPFSQAILFKTRCHQCLGLLFRCARQCGL